jgi:hypothetical protein
VPAILHPSFLHTPAVAVVRQETLVRAQAPFIATDPHTPCPMHCHEHAQNLLRDVRLNSPPPEGQPSDIYRDYTTIGICEICIINDNLAESYPKRELMRVRVEGYLPSVRLIPGDTYVQPSLYCLICATGFPLDECDAHHHSTSHRFKAIRLLLGHVYDVVDREQDPPVTNTITLPRHSNISIARYGLLCLSSLERQAACLWDRVRDMPGAAIRSPHNDGQKALYLACLRAMRGDVPRIPSTGMARARFIELQYSNISQAASNLHGAYALLPIMERHAMVVHPTQLVHAMSAMNVMAQPLPAVAHAYLSTLPGQPNAPDTTGESKTGDAETPGNRARGSFRMAHSPTVAEPLPHFVLPLAPTGPCAESDGDEFDDMPGLTPPSVSSSVNSMDSDLRDALMDDDGFVDRCDCP